MSVDNSANGTCTAFDTEQIVTLNIDLKSEQGYNVIAYSQDGKMATQMVRFCLISDVEIMSPNMKYEIYCVEVM